VPKEDTGVIRSYRSMVLKGDTGDLRELQEPLGAKGDTGATGATGALKEIQVDRELQ